MRHPIDIARRQSLLDTRRIHLDAKDGRAIHRRRERLRAAHPAQSRSEHEAPSEGALEMLAGHRTEGLEGALQNSLRPDVDPRAGGHLAIHHEPRALELAEL